MKSNYDILIKDYHEVRHFSHLMLTHLISSHVFSSHTPQNQKHNANLASVAIDGNVLIMSSIMDNNGNNTSNGVEGGGGGEDEGILSSGSEDESVGGEYDLQEGEKKRRRVK